MSQHATDKPFPGRPPHWQFSLRGGLLVVTGAAVILAYYRQIDHEWAGGAALVCCGLLGAAVVLSSGVRARFATITLCTYLPFILLIWIDWRSLTRGKDWNENILNVLPILPGLVPKVLLDHRHWEYQQEAMGIIALLWVACGTFAARRLPVTASGVVLAISGANAAFAYTLFRLG